MVVVVRISMISNSIRIVQGFISHDYRGKIRTSIIRSVSSSSSSPSQFFRSQSQTIMSATAKEDTATTGTGTVNHDDTNKTTTTDDTSTTTKTIQNNNLLVVNEKLQDALTAKGGREVLFAFAPSSTTIAATASAAFLAIPGELDVALRDELERIDYGL